MRRPGQDASLRVIIGDSRAGDGNGLVLERRPLAPSDAQLDALPSSELSGHQLPAAPRAPHLPPPLCPHPPHHQNPLRKVTEQ